MSYAVKRKLGASSSGKGVKVVSTSTPGTLIHTSISGTTPGTFDEIWLYAYNGHTSDVVLTVEWGGTATEDNIVQTIPYKQGLFLVVAGNILQNSLEVRAFASVANVVVISGYVNSMAD